MTFMTSSPLFLGLDVGTQSVRAALFDLRGNARAFATAPLDTTFPQPGWAEQDPEQWWRAACTAVPQALASAGAGADAVAGIGLDCTACTVVACRTDAVPLRPALLWMDQRAHREAQEISQTGDASLRFVSGAVSPEWMLPKALWLKRHEPAVYDEARRIVECTDWFMFRLTGEWTLSLNNVTVKWNYDRPEGGWSAALLRQDRIGRTAAQVARAARAARARRPQALGSRRGGIGPAARHAGGAGRHRRLPGHARHGSGTSRRPGHDYGLEHLSPGHVGATPFWQRHGGLLPGCRR